jgi:hypothetical protein
MVNKSADFFSSSFILNADYILLPTVDYLVNIWLLLCFFDSLRAGGLALLLLNI